MYPQPTKIFARIITKHDLEVNWQNNSNFVPLQGELIIYDCEVDSDGNTLELPSNRVVPYTYERLKIGDGFTLVNDLPFVDESDPTVPAWAKEATKPTYTAEEVGALPSTTKLADLADDVTHRTVTDTEKANWNAKSDFSGNYNDLTNLPVYDTTPTLSSTNPVTSGGLFNKFTEHEEQINTALAGAHSALSGALTWDGVIGNKEVIILDSNEAGTTSLVHVSDEYPEILSLFMSSSEPDTLLCTITMSGLFAGTVGESPVGQVPIEMLPGGLAVCETAFIVPSDNYTPPEDGGIPVTFPKKGVYFMCMTFNEIAALGFSVPSIYVSALSLAPFHSFADNSGGDASKYFEEKDIKVDTLTWDGDITGREYVAYEVMPEMVAYICRLSDNVLTEKDVINGLTYTEVSFQTGLPKIKTMTAAEAQACFMEDGRFACGAVLSVPVDNYTYERLILPKAGIYFMGLVSTDGSVIPLTTYITIPGYNFGTDTLAEVIKTEHLPQALRFGEIETTIESDTLTWDGNTEGLVQLSDMQFYKVSDVIPTVSDLVKGLSFTVSDADGNSESMNIPAGYVAEFIVENPDAPVFYITAGGSDSEAAVVYVLATTVGTDPSGIYLRSKDDVYISSFTINGYKFTTTNTELVKIDKRYLPDDIGGGGSGLPEVSAEDNSKTVKVVDGEWSVEQLSYNDLSDKPTISLSGAVSGSANLDGSTNINIVTSNAQHISNKSSGTYYYKLGTMVADNSGNYGNITISGRLGGWEQVNSANFDIMMLNRSSARDGNTITATVSASGSVQQALTNCDIVVYRQSDTSEIVYLKLSGYWLYDFDWNVYQHSINYSATNVTPTGTLVWSLSTTPKTILDTSGKFYINGDRAATMNDVNSAIEAAIGAAIAASY